MVASKLGAESLEKKAVICKDVKSACVWIGWLLATGATGGFGGAGMLGVLATIEAKASFCVGAMTWAPILWALITLVF